MNGLVTNINNVKQNSQYPDAISRF